MNNNELHELFYKLSDKNEDYLPHSEIDLYLDRASMWLFNRFREIYGENIDSCEAIIPFKKKLDFTTGVNGILTVSALVGYSDEFIQLLNVQVSVLDAVTNLPRKWDAYSLKDDENSSERNSQICPPSATYPRIEATEQGVFQFYPEQVHGGTVRYLRRPKVPVTAYTQVGRVFTYQSGSSTQLEWTAAYQSKVLWKALMYAGVPISDQMLIELGLSLPKENV